MPSFLLYPNARRPEPVRGTDKCPACRGSTGYDGPSSEGADCPYCGQDVNNTDGMGQVWVYPRRSALARFLFGAGTPHLNPGVLDYAQRMSDLIEDNRDALPQVLTTKEDLPYDR